MEIPNSTNISSSSLLKATDVAKRLNISRSKAYQLLQSDDLPTVRFDGTVRVCDCDLEEYINRHRSGWKQH